MGRSSSLYHLVLLAYLFAFRVASPYPLSSVGFLSTFRYSILFPSLVLSLGYHTVYFSFTCLLSVSFIKIPAS